MFLLEDINKLAYITVEVAHTKEDFVFSGIFAGIGRLDIDVNSTLIDVNKVDYLFLFNEKLYFLNLKSYKIKSVSVGNRTSDGSVSNLTYSLGYNSAKDGLEEIYNELKKCGKVLKNGLIDLSKFIEPKEFVKTRLEKYNALLYRKEVNNTIKQTTVGFTTSGTSVNNEKIVKEPTTTIFSRTSKYDIESAIKAMNSKFRKMKSCKKDMVGANTIQQIA